MPPSHSKIASPKVFVSILPVLAWVTVIYLPALTIYLRGDDFVDINYSIAESFTSLFDKTFLFFRPTADLLLFLNFYLSGTEELGYNLTTILLHLVNVALLWTLVYRVTQRAAVAVATSLLFGTSPFYVEATLWAILRNDSMLLAFFLAILLSLSRIQQRSSLRTQSIVMLLTVGALGTKENWLILPPLALLFLVLVLRCPVRRAVLATLPGLVLAPVYAVVFFLLPRLGGGPSPLDYSSLDGGGVQAVLGKLAFLLFHLCGLSHLFTGQAWQVGLALAGLGMLFVLPWILRNRLALFGAVFMVLSMLPTIHIPSSNSRFNYLPVAGFWIVIAALSDSGSRALLNRVRIDRRLTRAFWAGVVGVLALFQSIIVQREIDDYYLFGEFHRQVVKMYDSVQHKIPRDAPFLFANLGTRNRAVEFHKSTQGIYKVINPKPGEIWEIIDFAPLANFTGDPLTQRIVRIPESALDEILLGNPPVLVFRDRGFSFTPEYGPDIRKYFRAYGSLPPRVQAYRVVPLHPDAG